MLSKIAGCMIPVLMALGASGQTPVETEVERVLVFRHAETPLDFQELATVIRSITDIRHLSVDASQKTLSLRADPAKLGVAEWLFTALDQQPPVGRDQKFEYRVPGNDEDLVRLFYLAPERTLKELQSTALQMRTVSGARRLFTYGRLRAVAIRGNASQIGTAERIIQELEKR
jgi:hypothetical protein